MKETKKQKEKIAKVMHEFKEGELHIGKSDKIVKNPKQAVAIALSQANASKMADGGGVWTKEQREKVAKLDKEFEEYVKEKGIQRNSYEASLAWREGGFKKRMGEIFGKEYGKYANGGGVESSFNSTKKGLEGKDQQHRIDELINVVKKNNWSSKPLTVESGVVKTYAKMYDLEPIRVASIFNKYQKPKYAKGGDIYSKSSYEAMLRKYDQLGAKLEDAIDEKNTNEVARLKSEMNALESKINNYERGGSSFTYSIGGL